MPSVNFNRCTLLALLIGYCGLAWSHYVEPDPIGLQGGINPYVYAASSPINNFDRLGLTAEDVNVINEYISQHFPDINRRGSYDYGAPSPGADASTSPWNGVTTLPSEFRCKKLSLNDFEQLFDTMLHESMHSTDSALQAAWDAFWQPGLTANHQSIYNRVSYETALGHRARLPGPMWGSPTDFIPEVVGLYNTSRERANKVPCGCQ